LSSLKEDRAPFNESAFTYGTGGKEVSDRALPV
jgi:hypothetical protein